jgi:hypothetical protein
MTVIELIDLCGEPCQAILSKYPLTLTVIGLGIVLLIFIRLRKIDRYVTQIRRETLELKKIARFPYCDECPYKDSHKKRITGFDECTYEYRKSLVAR